MSKSKSSQPRYRTLADSLIADIRSGALPVGDKMPGEIELTEKFGVSRYTVRDALRVLGELGLIDRRQGIGTIVRARAPVHAYVQTVRSPGELMRYPSGSKLYVASSQEIKADRALARRIGVPAGSRWLHVNAVRKLRGGKLAISAVDVYLLPQFAGIVGSIGRAPTRLYELLERRYDVRVSEVGIDIGAGVISEPKASLLRSKQGTPSLIITRKYLSESHGLFQIAVSEHPSDRFTYSLNLTRRAFTRAPPARRPRA